MSGPTVFMPKDVLTRLPDGDWFKKFIVGYYDSNAVYLGLSIRMAASALFETYTQWSGDVARIRDIELKGGTPDHFKQAGHLAYWLRRCKPVYELNVNESTPPSGSDDEIKYITDHQKLLMKYTNEYFAFSLGYHICLLHSIKDETEAKNFWIDENYLEIVCQFLRNKNVSPHALFLIYRSLFYRPKPKAA